ncbi:MAG: acyltransferase [Treponema sp.]|nr:acyltransferase [Treponema sp.]
MLNSIQLNSTQLNTTQLNSGNRSLKNRNSNVELLRIIAMFLIVLTHTPSQSYCAGYGLEACRGAKVFMEMVSCFGTVGNCIFIMISSWFLLDSKFSWKNVFRIWFSVFSVSLIICSIVAFSKLEIVSFLDAAKYLSSTYDEVKHIITGKELRLSVLPMYSNIYWFAGSYLIFYTFAPFLNVLVKNLDQKNHLKLVLLCYCVVCILPLFPHESLYYPMNNGLDMFLVCYMAVTYVKRYKPVFLKNGKRNILVGILLIFFILIVSFLCNYFLFPKHGFVYQHVVNVWSLLLSSFFLFCGFVNLEPKYNKFIIEAGSLSFGVYLFHGHPLIYPFVLQKIFKVGENLTKSWIIPYTLLVTIIVYVAFSLCELLRKELLEKKVMKLIFTKKC